MAWAYSNKKRPEFTSSVDLSRSYSSSSAKSAVGREGKPRESRKSQELLVSNRDLEERNSQTEKGALWLLIKIVLWIVFKNLRNVRK